MIKGDGDDSHDFVITCDSPEPKDNSHECVIIEESPRKDELDPIVEVISPEVNKAKRIKISRQNYVEKNRKKSSVKRKLLDSRPALDVNIVKRTTSMMLDKNKPLDLPAGSSPKQICNMPNFMEDRIQTPGRSGFFLMNSPSASTLSLKLGKRLPLKKKTLYPNVLEQSKLCLLQKNENIKAANLPQKDVNEKRITLPQKDEKVITLPQKDVNTKVTTSPQKRENEKVISLPKKDVNKKEITLPQKDVNTKVITFSQKKENEKVISLPKNDVNKKEITFPQKEENKKSLPHKDVYKKVITLPQKDVNKKVLTFPWEDENKKITTLTQKDVNKKVVSLPQKDVNNKVVTLPQKDENKKCISFPHRVSFSLNDKNKKVVIVTEKDEIKKVLPLPQKDEFKKDVTVSQKGENARDGTSPKIIVNKEVTIHPTIVDDVSQSISDRLETSLNLSYNSREERIVDVTSQPYQILFSQDLIIDDSEPIIDDSPCSSIKMEFNEPIADKSESTKEHIEKSPIEPIEANTESNDLMHNKSLAAVKKAKKGGLLERANKVISRCKRNAILYSHELAVGLRTSRGYLASDILVVKSVSSEKNSFIVECVPLFSDGLGHIKSTPISTFLYTTELSPGVQANSQIVVHFPVFALFDVLSKIVIAFVDTRIQVLTNDWYSSPQVTGNSRFAGHLSRVSKKIFRHLRSRLGKHVLDAVIGSSLIASNILELDVLHIYTNCLKNKIALLTVDSEETFCMVYLETNNSATALRKDAIYTFNGFHLTSYSEFNSKMNHTAEYYLGKTIKPANKYIYIFEASVNKFKIDFVKNSVERKRPSFSIDPDDNPFHCDIAA